MKEEEQKPILIGIKEACKLTGIGRNKLLDLVKVKGFPALIFPRENPNRQRGFT